MTSIQELKKDAEVIREDVQKIKAKIKTFHKDPETLNIATQLMQFNSNAQLQDEQDSLGLSKITYTPGNPVDQ